MMLFFYFVSFILTLNVIIGKMDDLVAQQSFDIAKQIRQIKYSTNESIS